MNDLDGRLDALLRDETLVGPRALPAGTQRRVARRHASRVAVTCAGIFAGIALVVAVLGPLTGGSAAPSVTPAAPGIPAPLGYVQPEGWPRLDLSGPPHEADSILTFLHGTRGIADPTVLVAGFVNDVPFGLMAYRKGPAGPMCGGVVGGTIYPNPYAAGKAWGPGGPCSTGWFIEVPSQRDMLASTNAFDKPFDTFELFEGIVSHKVQRIQVVLDDGTEATFPTIPGPAGSPIDYVFVFMPVGATGRVDALDANGDSIDHAQICLPGDPSLPASAYHAGTCTGSPAHL